VSIFQFKQFSVNQTDAPFKVGTDSMVLGAWAEVSGDEMVLDIGAGTGVLSLMLAQKLDSGKVLAIEPNSTAFKLAESNFHNSPFRERLICINEPLQNIKPNKKFNIIISNPPYFRNSTLNADHSSASARHSVSLTLDYIAEFIANNLKVSGKAYLVLPSVEAEHITGLLEKSGLFLEKQLLIKDNPEAKTKRECLCFRFGETSTAQHTLVLKTKQDSNYTQAYKELTNAYHTHF